MGANLAKNSGNRSYTNPYANRIINPVFDKKNEVQSPRTPSAGAEPVAEKNQLKEEGEQLSQTSTAVSPPGNSGYASSDDEFYDGIPRYKRRTLWKKSRPRRHKVSEVSSLIGRAGSAGLGKAAGVLESLGSTVAGFNSSSKFVTGASPKNNELSILSFEVANTIVKGSCIMQSLSERSIGILKEVVFPSQGVQQLISTDLEELLNVVAVDKRKELKIFSGEVVRFGNRCKDSQWHNLDRFFEKHSRGTSLEQLRDQAEVMMQQLMVLVRQTAELYQELHTLDKLEQDYQHMQIDRFGSNTAQGGKSFAALEVDIKTQKRLVRNLKKKSLWSRSLEEVVEKLVDIVLFLNREITIAFDVKVDDSATEGEPSGQSQRLGSAGLALHYANIILLIDSIVGRSSSIPSYVRDTLYQSLPPRIKSSLRSKLRSFHVKEELSITEIKVEMEKTLHWLVPVATNTAKAYHGFGWVGEWANTGSESSRQAVVQSDFIRAETLHYANKSKTETYILELLLWLNYLVNRSKASGKEKELRHNSPTQITEKQTTLQDALALDRTQGVNKSEDPESTVSSSDEPQKLIGNSSRSGAKETTAAIPDMQSPSTTSFIDFGLDKEKKLNMIDRVELEV